MLMRRGNRWATAYSSGGRSGFSEFADLLARGQIIGRDLALSTTLSGGHISPLSGLAVGANETDITTIGGLPFVGVYGGATNLVAADMTDAGWTYISNPVNVEDLGGGEYELTFASAPCALQFGAILNASKDRWAGCKAKLVSGSFAGVSTDYLSYYSGGSVGTPFALEDLTSEYQDIECFVPSSQQSDSLWFRCSGGSPVIRIKYMRAVDSLIKHPPFPHGTAAGQSYGSAITSCSPTWPSVGCVFQAAILYGSGNASGFGLDMYRWSSVDNWIGYISNSMDYNSGLLAWSSLASHFVLWSWRYRVNIGI